MTDPAAQLALTDRQQAILQMLRDEPGLTTPMLARAITLPLNLTNRALTRLVELGLVQGVPTQTGAVT